MNKMEDILFELLQSNDCVVVPEFGGFIAKQRGAKIDHEKGFVFPAFRELSFNIQLNQGDGLLVNRYSSESGLSYLQSEQSIAKEVSSWNEILKNNQRLNLSKIGGLWKDVEGNIQFEQDRSFNLLLNAFGLEAVQFVSAQQIETINVEAKILPIQRKKYWKYAAAAAVVLPLAFYSYWIPMHTPVIESGMISYHDFNPFDKHQEAQYHVLNLQLPELPKEVETHEYQDLFPDLNPEPLPNTTGNEVLSFNSMHCIAGCFASLDNATRFINKLKTLGFDAQIISEGGLQKVSLGSAVSTEALQVIINKANANHIDFWILK